MGIARQIAYWLETHWIAPSYSGWLLLGLAVFFFIAGANTLAGWLYVISGISLALLAIAAILSERTLRSLQVHRVAIHPVSAGDQITVELIVENRGRRPQSLLQIYDQLPLSLGEPLNTAIEDIAPGKAFHWVYRQLAHHRGIYHWDGIHLRSGAPLGLFWCRRQQIAKAKAVVYPTVLPLTHCPLVDQMGWDENLLEMSDRRAQSANEGLTQSLRPYRWGDPIRLVHWRTSARYGELRLREQELFTGGQDLVICLDSAQDWGAEGRRQKAEGRGQKVEGRGQKVEGRGQRVEGWGDGRDGAIAAAFEEAVMAAASLYFYAYQRKMSVRLWTAGTGIVQGNQWVLEVLAGVQAGEIVRAESLPTSPIIWLTSNPDSLNTLPAGSRSLWNNQLWNDQPSGLNQMSSRSAGSGIRVKPDESLQSQLQSVILTSP